MGGDLHRFEDAFRALQLSSGVFAQALAMVATSGWRYRQFRFGFIGDVLYHLKAVDTDSLLDMHFNINTWTDEEIQSWKHSQMSTCNAIAVAGAIFASIGLIALQLPNMNEVHWTARGFCASSMILGIFSVTTSTSQYQALSQLNNALSVRLWLSRGRPTYFLLDKPLNPVKSFFSQANMQQRIEARVNYQSERQRDRPSKYHGFYPLDQMPLESSISALKIVSLPRHLLDMAVLLFIVGFSLYYLFLWLANIEDAGISCRNIFILFIVVIGVFLLYSCALYSYKMQNDAKKASEFQLERTKYKLDRDTAIQELEDELRKCQEELGSLRKREAYQSSEQVSATNNKSNTGEVAEMVAVSERGKDEGSRTGGEMGRASWTSAAETGRIPHLPTTETV